MDKTIDINLFHQVSANGQLFTAFGFVIAVNQGVLMLAPWTRVSGNLSQLVHLCPVPYQEVLLSIETQTHTPFQDKNHIYSNLTHQIVHTISNQWFFVRIEALQAVLFEHESGLKIVLANELALKKGDAIDADK